MVAAPRSLGIYVNPEWVSNRENGFAAVFKRVRAGLPMDARVPARIVSLKMSKMPIGIHLRRSINYFGKKGVGSLSVCGADVFHRWRSESLPAHTIRHPAAWRQALETRIPNPGQGWCQTRELSSATPEPVSS